MASPPPVKLDLGQIIQRVFDEDNGRLRTDSSFSGSISIDIDKATDSIAIGTETDFFTGTHVGPKFALDVVQTKAQTTPLVANFDVILANTEYSYVIPDNTTLLMLTPRTGTLQLSYTSGGPYRTVKRGQTYTVENLNMIGVTLFIQSSAASDVIEIETWSET